MSLPQITPAWVLRGQSGIEGLELIRDLPIPPLKEDEVLVKIYAASLNYRDVAVVNGGIAKASGRPTKENLVPGSDGAGVVEAVGSKVRRFIVGDPVCTHLTCGLAEDELPGWGDIGSGLGHTLDGTLRQFATFHETSLVKMPAKINFMEAATLTCSGLTAWNALFGLGSKIPCAGSTVLVQGTGGVSIAALQFAIAAGADVIATTSSPEKAEKLKALGAKQVINYRETPDWGEKAKTLTADGKGVDVIVDVGGPSTLQQSLRAVRRDGLVSATGLLGDSPDGKVANILDCIFVPCIARGILLGSRTQFDEMNQFVEKHDIRPVLDDKIFEFAETKEAFGFMTEQRHFSKIGIRICEDGSAKTSLKMKSEPDTFV